MKMNKTSMWFKALSGLVSVALILTSTLHTYSADPIPGPHGAGARCEQLSQEDRDVRGFWDSCIPLSQGNCPSQGWCSVVGALADGWYCNTCENSEDPTCYCTFNAFVYTYMSDGECLWGTVNPAGECYCRYDENNLIAIYIVDCSS